MTRKSSVSILLALALCVVSCNRTDLPQSQEKTVLRLQAPVASAMSKTWIDASAGSSVAPVYWSVGDQIWVNGVISSPLEADPGAEKMASASFYLTNVSAPYNVVYPHSSYAGKGEDGSLLLDIPSSQEWKEGSFSEGSALLYGYSESDNVPVQMQNLCGAITFTLKDPSSVKVQSLSITSLSEGKPIAGRFLLDTESLVLTGVGANSSSIEMELPEEGLSITPEGTSFFFSLPAGDYPDGFVIRLKDENRHILRCWWLRPGKGAEAGVTLGAGKLVVFKPQDYDPDAREICSGQDWEEFATAYNAGGDGWKADWLCKDGTIRIGEDFTAESLTRLNSFSHILDGGGYTVTITNGTTPLVKTLSGTIRNLTVAGTNVATDPSSAGATVFVTTLSGGTIEGCCNKAVIQTEEEHFGPVIAGPFVRTFTSGRIENCVNEGAIRISMGLKKSASETTYIDRYLLAGGIVALVKTIDGEAVIKDCVNTADISVSVLRPVTGATAAPLQAGYGGIVGSVISGTADKYLDILSCHNLGNIAVDYSPVPESGTKVSVSAAGGIVGGALTYKSGLTFEWYSSSTTQVTSQNGVYLHMKGCTSTGNIHNGLCHNIAHGDPNMNFAAGLIGVANGLDVAPILIEDCTVKDNTIEAISNTYYQRTGFCMVSAGLAGFAGHAHFKNCTVKNSIIGSLKQPSYAVAGGIGMAPVTFQMEGCRIFAHLKQIRCYISGSTDEDKKARTTGHYAMAFSLSTKRGPEGSTTGYGGMRNTLVNIEGSSVTGCSFGGTITMNTQLVLYSAKSGFSEVAETIVSSSNFQNYMTCDTFNADYYKRSIPSMVTLEGNQYWDGQ